jgi:hypothetical protein
MLSKFIADRKYKLSSIFDEEKAKNLEVIGKFVKMADRRQLVLKVQIKRRKIEEQEIEADRNLILDPYATETTRMIEYVPAQDYEEELVFDSGAVAKRYSYMVFPLQGPSLLDFLNKDITYRLLLSNGLKQYICS